MHPARTSRPRRHARTIALVVVAALLVVFLRGVSLGSPLSARAAVGPLQGINAAGGLVSQADNCITTTNTIPPTPLPNALAQPTANAGGPYTGSIGNPILFVGSGTPSRNSSILTCIWNFGDGTTANFLTPNHVYAISGQFTATLTITDSSGATATASTTVTVGGFVPLCQQPALAGNSGLQPCQTSGNCVTSTLNNNCQTICAQTGEIFIPGNCPGPSTGNQITITGPYALQVEQPFTVNAQTNLPAFSDLANGDVILFDFGDSTVVTNVPPGSVIASSSIPTGPSIPFPGNGGGPTQCADGSVSGSSGSGTCSSHGGEATFPQGTINPAFPASTSATHAYTQGGNYTITASVKFSNGTISVAKTTATVTGSSALPQAALTPVAALVQRVLVPLNAGCNHVILSFPDGTAVTAVAAAVQGTTLVSIYETPANAPSLGYFPDPAAPSNLVSVRHGDMALICVQGSGVLPEPAS